MSTRSFFSSFGRARCAPQTRKQPILSCEKLEQRHLLAALFPQFIDPNPAPGNQFGHTVLPLSTGNVVVTSPYDDFGGTDAGAVYLFNGATGARISTLIGTHANDHVGRQGVVALTNGNYVVRSADWDNGAETEAGAATWGSGTTGVSGSVGVANSLVGSTKDDHVGLEDIEGAEGAIIPLTNGNYVVNSDEWDNAGIYNAGAVTWGNGTTGVKGVIGAANSLVGSRAGDHVGYYGVTPLTNGNYVVSSPLWTRLTGVFTFSYAGAVTWGNGATGLKGLVSEGNSLVGSNTEDFLGYGGVTALTNGNYVVCTPDWDGGAQTDAGAITWGNGTTGISGTVSYFGAGANSLVGNHAGDQLGYYGATALPSGNYVVHSSEWNGSRGAVTWGSGTSALVGTVDSSNSLVGSTVNDSVGFYGITVLTNGNYVVNSPFWNGAATYTGAVTWGSGATGVQGIVSAANSLVGSTENDLVGYRGITPLTNGNYAVNSSFWDNGEVVDAGAVTWGRGTTGIQGLVSPLNSLVGASAFDYVGIDDSGVTALSNGNYVVSSPNWDNFGTANVGAATWGSGTSGVKGLISANNSLIGSRVNDLVGGSYGITALSNGNYVVSSPDLDSATATNVGAATWGNGTTGVKGVVNSTNSLLGSRVDDRVGETVTALTNGNYVVRSPHWDNGAATQAGAATWGNGATGIKGTVNSANSLVGSRVNDRVGAGGVTALANGNYVVNSPYWTLLTAVDTRANAGAVTFGIGIKGINGPVTSLNSGVGLVPNTGLAADLVADNVNGTFSSRFLTEGGGIIRIGSQSDGFNTPPVLANFGGDVSYRENAAALRISTTIKVSDGDSTNFATGRLIVKLSAGARAEDRLTIITAGNITTDSNNKVLASGQIIGTFSGGVGTAQLIVNFNSKATPLNIQQLLRQIAYKNISENPATNSRTVRVTLNDGDGSTSAAITKKINVSRVNDAPLIAPANGGTAGYVNNAGVIGLLSNATVTDPDSTNFAGGKLLVRAISGGNASNRLLIGTAFTITGNNVRLNDTTIGTLNANGGIGTTRMEITFNANATRVIVQQLVRAIRFRTVGGSSTTPRVIEFLLTDGGGGGASNKVTKTVNVTNS